MNPEDVLRELRDPDRWSEVRVPRSAGRRGSRGRVSPARATQLVAAFGVAIVAVVAILVGLESLRHATPPAAPPTSPAASASPSASTGSAVFTIVPGSTREYTAGTLPPGCALGQLRTASKQDGGGAAGSYIQSVTVRNDGADCVLAPDAVRVGTTTAPLSLVGTTHGFVIPARGTGRLVVTTPSACQPDGTSANIDPSTPSEPIALRVGGATRVLAARFPRSRCRQPVVEADLDGSAGAPSGSALAGLGVTVDEPVRTPPGDLRYAVTLEQSGATALVLSSCPSATEVLVDDEGTTVTRDLALGCARGTTLEPDVPVTIAVTTTVPAAGPWRILWFLGGGSATSAAATTCTLAQLQVSEPGPGGASTGIWVQLVRVHDDGAACTLPASAFALSGTVARAGTADGADGFHLAAGSTTELSVEAGTVCSDGAINIASPGSIGADGKPIVLTLGGRSQVLDQAFPRLACAGPFVDRVG